jgi:starch synthase
MPSRFEPCGLNQMYSLRYGTAPVVRAVGGLDDTVEDDGADRGTGFKFREYRPGAMLAALKRAVELYRDRRAWAALLARGMAQDFSWATAASHYERLFERLLR